MPRLFTDLTDAQWGRVRSAAFLGDALRPVVDRLLFRERAWVPWSLLPDGLRERFKAWDADGTWRAISRAATDPPAPVPVVPPPSFVQKVRRKLARPRPGPASELPALFKTAHDIALEGRNSEAEALYDRVLALDPTNALSLVRRGRARYELHRYADAVADAMLGLSSPAGCPRSLWEGHQTLAVAHLRLGDLDRAVRHQFVTLLLHKYGEFAPWRQDELAEEPDEFELLAVAHTVLAEVAVNHHSDYATADEMYRRREVVREAYRTWLATVPPRTVYLTEDWVRNIGHSALIDMWLKMRELGWAAADRVVLVAPPGETANRAYVRCYEPHLKVIADPTPGGASRHLAAAFGPRVASILTLPTGDRKYFLEGMGAIQEAWERDGRGPLLRLPADDAEFGRAKLREMGVPDGAWFACLHVRTAGFHKEGAIAYQTQRNAGIETYLPAIREIVRRGGWVVRLGDASMPALPPTPGLIDYAVGPHKSERLDIFLCASCRFFVGVASGMAHVPTTFGVPCLLTNWASNAFPVYSRRDLFIPKRTRAGDRVLPFAEWLSPAVRQRLGQATEMIKAGLTPVDNTPDELTDAAAEMMDRLDGVAEYTPDDEARLAAFEAMARANGLVGFSRIGRDFLRRHAELLGEVAARRAA